MISQYDLGWIVAWLEGEGCFGFGKNRLVFVTANQVQKWPLEKCLTLFGGSLYEHRPSKTRPRESPSWVWRVSGPQAVGLMMMVYARMSPRRKDQIRHALRQWQAVPAGNKYKRRCKHGHEFTPENTYTWHGKRQCIECRSLRSAARGR